MELESQRSFYLRNGDGILFNAVKLREVVRYISVGCDNLFTLRLSQLWILTATVWCSIQDLRSIYFITPRRLTSRDQRGKNTKFRELPFFILKRVISTYRRQYSPKITRYAFT